MDLDLLSPKTIDYNEDEHPRLIVVIDTEEEFDWNKPMDRSSTGVRSMLQIDLVQEIFDSYAIKPCYVVDYPIVTQEDGYSKLLDINARGRCEIGAHLHPWVNPPFSEKLTPANTFPGNLPFEIEEAKLLTLTDQIENIFGSRPTIYKAGRYGVGANTPEILKKLGYRIDLSHCPPVDYTRDEGPDFRRAPSRPGWLGPDKDIFEIPATGGYTGWLGGLSSTAYDIARRFQRLKIPGVLSRIGAVDRLMLSPEGFSSEEHISLTKALLSSGQRTFTWSFHSPSVVPGLTPYVSDQPQLQAFLDKFKVFFDFFFEEMGGVASFPSKVRNELENKH